MSNSLLSFAGWYFLPNLVTGYVQSTLYTIFIRAGEPKPQPGSPTFIRHRKRIFTCVILAYLLYTVFEADYQLRVSGDFYRSLGVPHSASEREIQAKFRRLTVQHHPDKLSPGAPAAEKAAVEAFYLHLALARDTLADSAKHFAYDRFGPDMLAWRQCTTIRNFASTGMQRVAVYYAGSGAVLVLLDVLGYLRQGKFWRYLVMAALFVVEMRTVMRTDPPAILTVVINPFLAATKLRQPYLPFQMLILLRKLALTFFIALSQLGPILQESQSAGDDGTISAAHLGRIEALSKATDQEVGRLMGLELTPFVADERARQELQTSLKQWLVQNTIKNDPEVRAAIDRILDRRRSRS